MKFLLVARAAKGATDRFTTEAQRHREFKKEGLSQ
jgi:hypothetical protein